MHAPARSDAEARANATYEALMWALARPGLARDLPEPSDAAIVEALIDRECAVHCAKHCTEEDTGEDMARIVAQTGAALVAPSAADHLFLGPLGDATLLRQLRCGSDLYPDDGATAVIHVRLGDGPRLRFSGPGVDGTVDIAVGGLPDGAWDIRRDTLRYPMGFELLLRDGARVVGVPRSTVVEVL